VKIIIPGMNTGFTDPNNPMGVSNGIQTPMDAMSGGFVDQNGNFQPMQNGMQNAADHMQNGMQNGGFVDQNGNFVPSGMQNGMQNADGGFGPNGMQNGGMPLDQMNPNGINPFVPQNQMQNQMNQGAMMANADGQQMMPMNQSPEGHSKGEVNGPTFEMNMTVDPTNQNQNGNVNTGVPNNPNQLNPNQLQGGPQNAFSPQNPHSPGTAPGAVGGQVVRPFGDITPEQTPGHGNAHSNPNIIILIDDKTQESESSIDI
jgi:hypothetical protein